MMLMAKLLSCGNCTGGLVIEHDEAGITLLCPKCMVRVAGPFTDAGDIPEYKPARQLRRRR
jgi:hypothetical protein